MNRPLLRHPGAAGDAEGAAPFFAAFRHALQDRPDATAIVHYRKAKQAETVSYAALAEAAARRRAALRSVAAPGDLLFVLHDDVREQIEWWLAAAAAGMVPGILTPPTPKLPQDKYLADLGAILDAHPEATVVAGDLLDAGAETGRRIYPMASLLADAADADDGDLFDGAARQLDAPFVFQQSSGTTGLRKGVLLDEGAVTAQLASYGRAIGVREGDVIVSWLPLYHDMGFVACLLGSLYWGVPLVITSPFVWLRRPEWLVHAIAEHGGSLCWLPNFAFSLMAERVDGSAIAGDALTPLRLAVNCSEPVLAASMDAFARSFAANGLNPAAISSSYAMAENTFAVTQSRPGRPPVVETVDPARLDGEGVAVPVAEGRRVASSGRAIPGTEVAILREGRRAADGEVGEVLVSGDCLMRGYFGIGDEAPAIDGEGRFHTGDLGYLRDGELFVIARAKDIIIRAGRNIDPGCLEAAAGAVAGVKAGRAAAFPVANPAEGTDDIVVLAEAEGEIGEDAAQQLREAVVAACHAEVGLTPQAVRILPPGWLVKSSSGKIGRRLCREKYLRMMEGNGTLP